MAYIGSPFTFDSRIPDPGATDQVLKSDGAGNWTTADPAHLELPVPGAAGKVLTSDGTNWTSTKVSDALTTDLTPGVAGKVLASDGTSWISGDAPDELPAPGVAGQLLTSDGTNWVTETPAPGGGAVEAVASGALADGDKVILRSDGKVEAIDGTNLTATNFIGISDGVYADGATAMIQGVGVIDDAQSGLTIGSIYYVQTNGTLDTGFGDFSVLAGKALSATNLMIFANRPAPTAGGSITAIANGVISSGEVVILLSDGTVTKAGAGPNVNQIDSDTNEFNYTSFVSPVNMGDDQMGFKVSYDPNNVNKFVMTYRSGLWPNPATGTHQVVAVGSISGTTISFGAEVDVSNFYDETHARGNIRFHPTTANLFGIAWADNQGLYTKFGTVSGTTITMQGSNSYEMGNFNHCCIDLDWDDNHSGSGSASNQWVITYEQKNKDGMEANQHKMIIGQVSDNAASSAGSKTVLVRPSGPAGDSRGGMGGLQGPVAGRDGGSEQGRNARWDPFTAGKGAVIQQHGDIGWPPTDAVWAGAPVNNGIWLKIFTVSGTGSSASITLNAQQEIDDHSDDTIGDTYLRWNPNVQNQLLISYRKGNVLGWDGTTWPPPSVPSGVNTFVVGTVSGTTVTFGTPFTNTLVAQSAGNHKGPPLIEFPKWETSGQYFYACGGGTTIQVFKITGTTITAGTTTQMISNSPAWPNSNICFATDGASRIMVTSQGSTMDPMLETGVGNHGPGPSNLTSTNFLGIAL